MQYYIEPTVKVGKNVIIQPFAVVRETLMLDDGCVVESFSYIDNSYIGKNTQVRSSRITDSKVGNNCTVGPNAHIRLNSVVCDQLPCGQFRGTEKQYPRSGEQGKPPGVHRGRNRW